MAHWLKEPDFGSLASAHIPDATLECILHTSAGTMGEDTHNTGESLAT